jgi:uncharacterized membrane protein YedE/YeeE
MKWISVFVSALVFGVGLGVGGMLDPARVVGFLDFFGKWDPTLAFVMGGALAVNTLAYRLTSRRRQPLFDDRFHLPTEKKVTSRLILGSACFGVGWAIAGYCPGPALTTLGLGTVNSMLFVGAMGLGSWLAGRFLGARETQSAND